MVEALSAGFSAIDFDDIEPFLEISLMLMIGLVVVIGLAMVLLFRGFEIFFL